MLYGLGVAAYDDLRDYCKKDAEALHLLDQHNPSLRKQCQHGPYNGKGDNVTFQRGNQRSYRLARLQRDHPDVNVAAEKQILINKKDGIRDIANLTRMPSAFPSSDKLRDKS